MKKIFCLINIEADGVHALFCRLGFHVYDKTSAPIDYCFYCPVERENNK